MSTSPEFYKMMFRDYPDILTVNDLQKMLGISRHQAYHLIETGQIPGFKLGKAYKIPKIILIDYLLTGKACTRS